MTALIIEDMSHIRIKTKYNTEGSYGSTDTKTLYAHHNLSCDIVSFYDEDGECILSVEDTMENNQLDAINRLYAPYVDKDCTQYSEDIESMTPEERDLCNNYQNKSYQLLRKLVLEIRKDSGVCGDIESIMTECEEYLNIK
jgi:hypothetical protein